MFKQKLPKQDQGFTLVEVLVAILISTIFVAVSMQMMAIAAIFKVRAQEYAEATTWIQEDLENIKYEASNYQYTTLPNGANSTDSVLRVASVDGFVVGDTLIVGTDATSNTIAPDDSTVTPPKPGSDPATNEITLTAPLGTSWLEGTPVVATTRCIQTQTTGFADGLRDKITASVDDSNDEGIIGVVDIINPSKVFISKTYRLRRTTTISDDSPFNLLKINYEVASTSSLNAPIAKFYTEVIPNAALQCP